MEPAAATGTGPAAAGALPPAPASFLLERGLLSADQVAELLHAATRAGRTLEALALERGLVDEATLVAAAREYAAVRPEERQTPLRVAAANPGLAAPRATTAAAPATVEFAVAALLANGTALELEAHPTHDAAWRRAESLATALAGSEDDDWQRLGQSLVRPSAVLGFDVRPRSPQR